MSQSADDVFIDDDHRFVTVVDRTGLGGDITLRSGMKYDGTLYWDHKPHTIQAKPFQLRAPAAKHFFKYGSQAWLHDADGSFVCRLGIVDGDPDLISEIGPDFVTDDPIALDVDAVEGWDQANVAPDKKAKRTVKRFASETVAALQARAERD